MAQGQGELSVKTMSGSYESTTTSLQTVNAGIPFGYMFEPQRVFMPGVVNPPSVSFIHDGQAMAFSEGWGLSVEGLAGEGMAMKLPTRAPISVRALQRLNTGTRVMVLQKSPCMLHKERLPSCANESEQQRDVFEFSEFKVGGDSRVNYDNRRRTYCPDPHDLASCAPLAEQLGAPYRAEILAFLQRAKPEVDALLRRINSPAPPAAALAASPAAPSMEKAGSPAAAAAADTLEALPVGALFAAADEAASKGDKAGARAALRALLRRFPDHALAAAAAKQLTALQGQ
jgi:hypothetical protein